MQIQRNVRITATTQGVDDAARKLGDLSKAQDGVAVASDRTGRATESYQRRLDSIQRSLDLNFRNMQNMERVERDLARAREQGLISSERENELLDLARSRYESATNAGDGFAAMKQRIVIGATAAIAALAAGIEIARRYADQYTSVQNALKVAGLEGEDLRKTYDQLFAASQRQGAPLEAMTRLYGGIAQAQNELGVSSEEMLRFTEGVGMALRVAGTNSTQAAGALLQLQQALGSGTVRAEEFNSMLEGARPILVAVARGMEEAGGSVAKLRQMVNDGEVSSQAFFRAFQAGSAQLAIDADRASQTTSQGLTRINNALIDLVGKMDEATGFSRGLGAAMNTVADWLISIANGVPETVKMLNSLGDAFGRAARLAATLAGVRDNTPSAMQDPTMSITAEGAGMSSQMALSGNVTRDGLFRYIPNIPPVPVERPSIAGARIRAADFAPGNDNDAGTGGRSRSGAGSRSREERDALAEEIRRLEERTEAIRTATNVIGLDTFAREKALATQRLMSVAARDGTAATQAEILVIEEKATAYARAQAAAEEAHRAQRQYTDFINTSRGAFTGFFSDFANQIAQGKNVWQAFANAGLSALQKVSSKLLEMAATNVWQQLFGTAGGGGMFGGLGGGLFGGMFQGNAGPLNILPGLFANGGAFNDNGVIPFARGAAFTNSIVDRPTLFPFANGTGLMGEAGPEAIMPLKRDGAGRLGVVAQGQGGGSVAVTFAPSVNVSVQGSNSSSGDIGGAVVQAMKAAKDEFERDLPAMIEKAKRRGAIAA